MADWSPGQYLKFEDERTRPAAELLARVPIDRPRRIIDIGCGPGNSTELLLARYPDAEIVGLDSSPEMLAKARDRLPGVRFTEAAVETWTPSAPFDLVFANAVMQWVPDHLAVLARLLAACAPGGVVALQVPDNLDEPTHRSMADVAADGPWRDRFAEPIEREAIPKPAAYYDALKPIAAQVDVWHTVYYHPLDDHDAIVAWLKGSGLRPYLDRLQPEDEAPFVDAYRERIAASHPLLVDGRVLLRFPRLFVVAVKT
ncbi:trans-aconitate 2-methyltransferase [Bauldia sp.]|uniref:trans-aconitate 2-methyltransferase n=1 Tax=Bauldia sp. TaxID=2575872 RepID=UPI003BA9307C